MESRRTDCAYAAGWGKFGALLYRKRSGTGPGAASTFEANLRGRRLGFYIFVCFQPTGRIQRGHMCAPDDGWVPMEVPPDEALRSESRQQEHVEECCEFPSEDTDDGGYMGEGVALHALVE